MLRIANFSNWRVVTKSAYCFGCHGVIIELVLIEIVDKRKFLNKLLQFNLSTNIFFNKGSNRNSPNVSFIYKDAKEVWREP